MASDNSAELPFAIDSVDRLGWYGSKLINFKAERERIKENYKALLERSEKDEADFRDRFEEQAATFIYLNVKKDEQYIDTIQAGRVNARKEASKVKIDKKVLLPFIERTNPELLRTETIPPKEIKVIPDEVIERFKELEPDELTGELRPRLIAEGATFIPEHMTTHVTAIPRPRGINSKQDAPIGVEVELNENH